ncbi:MAG TPA: nuclear transport factor 2 family protein [Gammaproteobacteria bacterium]|nr:nuclear transport factor 2 family protein [Gammaproteobacteria bacterium]
MHRALALLALSSFSATAAPLDSQALSDWLRKYEHAWESRDAQAASRIFTENALYYETPYAEPFRGRKGIADYWAGVTADRRFDEQNLVSELREWWVLRP